MTPPTPVLQADALSFGYPGQPQGLLFDQLSVRLPPGVSWLCGDEGVGKTTLLQLLAGAVTGSGRVEINGAILDPGSAAHRQQVAWFDPRDAALDSHTARKIFSSLPERHPGFEPAALQAHIEGLSLAPHLDKALFMLSTGSRRKVFIAAALASQATVTLLDQPFMALDRPSIDYLLGVLAEAARHPSRAWVVADYVAPDAVALAAVIELGT
ncbi:MAG: ATP-binding cassette domain-containing protein [Polaromonas sp.]|nr:ATP-binding cassette domain-containing protein [Polaromonas sp.]